MAKTNKFHTLNTTMYGVFYIGHIYDGFRYLKAAFQDKNEAEEWAKNYSEENFNCDMMVEEINVTIPA